MFTTQSDLVSSLGTTIGAANTGSNPGPSSNTQKSTTAPSSIPTHIQALTIFNAYESNAALANSQYGGKTLYITGEVGDVEQEQNGNYQSCIMASTTGATVIETGCEYADAGYIGGYIVWNWKNQATAAALGNVSSPVDIVAECVVGGFQNGNLILNGCVIIQIT